MSSAWACLMFVMICVDYFGSIYSRHRIFSPLPLVLRSLHHPLLATRYVNVVAIYIYPCILMMQHCLVFDSIDDGYPFNVECISG